jgi:hypothetical protein
VSECESGEELRVTDEDATAGNVRTTIVSVMTTATVERMPREKRGRVTLATTELERRIILLKVD